MTMDTVLELSRAAIWSAILIASPMMLGAMIIGLVISILQAVMQIQDQALSNVPKIIFMMVMLLYLMPWGLEVMGNYTTDLFLRIPERM